MKGTRIKSLNALAAAAMKKQAVIGFHTYMMRPMPAAFLFAMQGRLINNALNRGVWIYKPKAKQ